MWPFSGCGLDACRRPPTSAVTLANAAGAAPFALVAVAATLAAARHGYPYLSRAARDDARDGEDHVLPSHAPAALRRAHADHGARSPRRRLIAWTFGVTVGLAAALGALILAEILDVGSRSAHGGAAPSGGGRGLALRLTIPALLFLLIGVVPWLECASVVRGNSSTGAASSRRSRMPGCAWLMQLTLFACWLFAFWKIGGAVPSSAVEVAVPARILLPSKEPHHYDDDEDEAPLQLLIRACLERIGVIGITLMGLLAGFASVSAPWHALTSATDRRRRPVTDADVNRKQAGLDAASEMLLSKRHRLQALEQRRLADPRAAAEARAATGFVGKMVGALRGGAAAASAEETEMRGLRVEIAGLATMEANLSSNLALLRGRRAADSRAATACGRACLVPSYLFAAYCVYRVAATALATLRRGTAAARQQQHPAVAGASFATTSDPVHRLLGLVARHWDPALDQAAWARAASFALSGVVLLASANSALQTCRLFGRWAPPALLRHARANLALAVGQVAATYMISASLLLRGQLPPEARSAVGGVLRGALSPVFVDGWFEGWFLTGSALTMLGLWLGRRLGGGGGREDDWDDYGGEEMGAKRM